MEVGLWIRKQMANIYFSKINWSTLGSLFFDHVSQFFSKRFMLRTERLTKCFQQMQKIKTNLVP